MTILDNIKQINALLAAKGLESKVVKNEQLVWAILDNSF